MYVIFLWRKKNRVKKGEKVFGLKNKKIQQIKSLVWMIPQKRLVFIP